MGRIGDAAVPVSNQELHGTSHSLRNYAGHALSLTGLLAVPTLIDALQDKNDSVRATAAYTLAGMEKAAAEAIPALTHAGQDESPLVRRHAIEGLGIIGQQIGGNTNLGQTVQISIEGLSDEHYWVRYNAARTLANWDLSLIRRCLI